MVMMVVVMMSAVMVVMVMRGHTCFAGRFLRRTGIIGLQYGDRVRNGFQQFPIARGGSEFRLRGRCGVSAAGSGQYGRGSEQTCDFLVHASTSRDLDYLSITCD